MKFFRFPVHPFFLAAFPVFALYYYNASEILPWVFVKPLIASLVLAALIFGVSKIILKDWLKAGLLASFAVFAIFSHGHIHRVLAYEFEKYFAQGQYQFFDFLPPLGIDDILVSVWGILGLALLIFLWRTKGDFLPLTKFMNFVSVFLFAVPTLTAAVYKITNIKPQSLQDLESQIGEEITLRPEEGIGYKPDIYYIILDRYAGEKTLAEIYGFDNRDFLNFLEEKGFYVASRSTMNYPRTLTSLAASLSLDYINFLSEIAGENTSDQTFAYPLVDKHKVGELLKSQGYRYLHLGSWFEPTKVSTLADQNFLMGDLYLGLDEFSTEFLETTLLAPVIRWVTSREKSFQFNAQHAERILYEFDRLKEIPPLDSPKFVFAHILIPHPPFVFDVDCETLPGGAARAKDSSKEAYLDQMGCGNKLVTDLVEKILADSVNPPVIILQADEGPYNRDYPMPQSKVGFDFKGASDETLNERFPILNALYLPGVGIDDLYPEMTPVNTFRFVFNKYFGANLEILPDKNYIYEDEDHFYKFIDVTERIER